MNVTGNRAAFALLFSLFLSITTTTTMAFQSSLLPSSCRRALMTRRCTSSSSRSSSALLLRMSSSSSSSANNNNNAVGGASGGASRARRPAPLGHRFQHQRFMTSRGDDDAFTPINPQTLNWEKIGPDQDVFVSALSQNGHVNVKVISAKNMVQEMKDKRGLSTVATELMGRVMLSAILVANGIKDQETLQLTFSGDGTAKGVMAISDGACNVRAWIGNPELGEELRDPTTGKANIRAAVGQGTLQVVKNHPSWRIPYNGVVEIASGEVGPDVAFYLASSEQRNTAIGVGLHLDPKTGKVESAGGFYIEMMPGVEEESITKVEVNLAVIKERFQSLDPGQLFAGEKPLTPVTLVKLLLNDLGISVAEETAPAYKCTCSKEKVFRAISLLSAEEVEDILSKEGRISAKCEFCSTEYILAREEVVEMNEQRNVPQ